MNNKNFTNLNENELYNTEGGSVTVAVVFTIIGAAAGVIALAYTAYQSNRSDAYASGKKAAYEDIKRN